MRLILVFCSFLHFANGQFAEIASIATSLLGSGLGPALGGVSSAGSAAAPGALGALSQIGQLYQLAQGALQLTGTGVGVLNQASEGNWFPAALETASKSARSLMSGMAVQPNLGSLGPRNPGNQIGPEFGTGFPAPNVEDYEDNSLNGVTTTVKAETLVNINDEDDFDEFTNPPTIPTATTISSVPITLFPVKPESNSVTDRTTAAPLKEIRIELPKNTKEQVDGDYIDEVKTDGISRIQITNKVRNDGDENLLIPATAPVTKLPNRVPNLPKLLEVLRKSNLKESDIMEIVSQIEHNDNVPSPTRIDFTSAVQNIPLKKQQNRERIVKASRELQQNFVTSEQGSTNQFNQFAQLHGLPSHVSGVAPTTFQPPITATVPLLNHLFTHLTRPLPDPNASNRLQQEIHPVREEKASFTYLAATSAPGLRSTQAQFTTPPNVLQLQQQVHLNQLQQRVPQQQQQQQHYYFHQPQQLLQQPFLQQQHHPLSQRSPANHQYSHFYNHPQYSTIQVSSAASKPAYRQFRQIIGQTHNQGSHVLFTNQPAGTHTEFNKFTNVALSSPTQQTSDYEHKVPSQAVQSNTENASAQPHNLKRRNYGSTGHFQLLGVRLPTTPQKVAFHQNAALPYRVDRSGVAAGPQRRYLIRTVSAQRVTTPPPVLQIPIKESLTTL
ncbi:hypothetical protein V3C99_018716 [Haemonchus contortus]